MSERNDFQQIQKQTQEQIQIQKATQSQVILGELITMNDDEVIDRIDAELNDNPALEERDAQDRDDDYGESSNDDDQETEVGQSNEDPFESPYTQSDDDYVDRDDDGLGYIQTRRRQSTADNDVYRPPVVNEASMYEVLMNQVRERDLTERQLLIAEYIIGEIDDDGLMRRPIASICGDIISRENEFVTPQEVQEVLEEIQDLEPAGIAATSTRECILLQIEDMKGENVEIAQIAHAIVDKHFEAYERHHYDKILAAMNIDEATFNLADHVIHLGKVLLRNDIPELQISESYEIEYHRITNRKNVKMRDDEALIKQQYEKASNFIKLLRLRQEKLYSIMKAIMLKQQEFFITGDTMTLKPLVLSDIAQATGYDVSTISRAQQNKYVDTNWGIYDLKFFFSKGINENETSSTAIKEIIKELVENENKKKPLSDEQLCNALQERGFPIKRRTVAKYRDSLKIPVARQRKTL